MKPMTSRFRVRRLGHHILNTMYPDAAVCVLCHRLLRGSVTTKARFMRTVHALDQPQNQSITCLEQLVCPLCLEDAYALSPGCYQRNLQIGEGKRLQTDAKPGQRGLVTVVPVLSSFPYEGFVQRLIRPWKYDGVIRATEWFVDSIERMLRQRGDIRFDAITPVPTSKARMQTRGYHHTLLLAMQLSIRLNKPVLQCLVRNSGAETQTAKSAVARRQTLSGVLQVDSPSHVSGANILLVDDVVTTGATLHACAMKLAEVGASSVTCSVIAHVN